MREIEIVTAAGFASVSSVRMESLGDHSRLVAEINCSGGSDGADVIGTVKLRVNSDDAAALAKKFGGRLIVRLSVVAREEGNEQ